MGTNFRLESGTPRNSFGYHPTDAFARAYRAASFYTNSKPVPRGTYGRTPWITQLDLNLRYKPTWAHNKVTFVASGSNLLNAGHVTEFRQAAETAVNTPSPSFGLPSVFQSPRSARLSMSYDY
ncbi:MAG: hypothetical protein EXS32_15370 [Opitutus sp.]|nr:hypothetical protein [Opitutus sp.]